MQGSDQRQSHSDRGMEMVAGSERPCWLSGWRSQLFLNAVADRRQGWLRVHPVCLPCPHCPQHNTHDRSLPLWAGTALHLSSSSRPRVEPAADTHSCSYHQGRPRKGRPSSCGLCSPRWDSRTAGQQSTSFPSLFDDGQRTSTLIRCLGVSVALMNTLTKSTLGRKDT